MKKTLIALLLTIYLFIGGIANAAIEDWAHFQRIATLKDSYIVAVEDAQADYFAEHGSYFQGKSLVDGKPNGVANTTINANAKPTDQETSWRDFDPVVFATGMALPVNIRIAVYTTQLGWNYDLIFEFWPDENENLGQDSEGRTGNHWYYIHHVGPSPKGIAYDTWFVVDDNAI